MKPRPRRSLISPRPKAARSTSSRAAIRLLSPSTRTCSSWPSAMRRSRSPTSSTCAVASRWKRATRSMLPTSPGLRRKFPCSRSVSRTPTSSPASAVRIGTTATTTAWSTATTPRTRKARSASRSATSMSPSHSSNRPTSTTPPLTRRSRCRPTPPSSLASATCLRSRHATSRFPLTLPATLPTLTSPRRSSTSRSSKTAASKSRRATTRSRSITIPAC